eukprot:jgi/Chrpa1/17816/Chrysochromulina_OHIO_Genome00022927-RA
MPPKRAAASPSGARRARPRPALEAEAPESLTLEEPVPIQRAASSEAQSAAPSQPPVRSVMMAISAVLLCATGMLCVSSFGRTTWEPIDATIVASVFNGSHFCNTSSWSVDTLLPHVRALQRCPARDNATRHNETLVASEAKHAACAEALVLAKQDSAVCESARGECESARQTLGQRVANATAAAEAALVAAQEESDATRARLAECRAALETQGDETDETLETQGDETDETLETQGALKRAPCRYDAAQGPRAAPTGESDSPRGALVWLLALLASAAVGACVRASRERRNISTAVAKAIAVTEATCARQATADQSAAVAAAVAASQAELVAVRTRQAAEATAAMAAELKAAEEAAATAEANAANVTAATAAMAAKLKAAEEAAATAEANAAEATAATAAMAAKL